MNRQLVILICLLVVTPVSSFGQHAHLKGNVQLPEGWKRMAYVCQIPDFGMMYQASNALLVADGIIDERRNFDIELPPSTQPDIEILYRLQFVRDEDPVSTIIIGSADENHVFFVAGKTDSITYNSAINFLQEGRIVDQSTLSGGRANKELNTLLALLKQDAIPRDSLKQRLIVVARTVTSELVRLLAVNSMFGLNDAQKNEVRIILSTHDRSNPYGTRIFEEYKHVYLWRYVLVVILATVGAVATIGVKGYRKRMIKKSLDLLSPRELHIARLIVDGKTNKDVAVILNIELSTVKTHVNNIYSKLKVNERKELARFESGLRSSYPASGQGAEGGA